MKAEEFGLRDVGHVHHHRGRHCLGGSREGLEGECQAWGPFCSWQTLLYSSGNWIPSLAPEKNEAAGGEMTGKVGLRQVWAQIMLGSDKAGITQSWDQAGLGLGKAGLRQGWDQAGLGSQRAGIRQGWDHTGLASPRAGVTQSWD